MIKEGKDAQKASYLAWPHEASDHYDGQIHAYALMTNHIFLLVTPECIKA